MDIKQVVLAELEVFAAAHPEIVERLAKVAKEQGAHSDSGKKDTRAEHYILNEASVILYHIRNNKPLSSYLKEELEEYADKTNFSVTNDDEKKLLADFYECLQKIAKTLGIGFTRPTREKISVENAKN